jgi:cysteine desulfuration protein SufE
MTYPPKLAQLLEDLAFSDDREIRSELLIELASRFKEVPQSIASRPFPKERRVPGCESEVYIWSSPNTDGTLKYYFAVENPQGLSAKAMSVLLDETLSGTPLNDIMEVGDDVVARVFGGAISMGKGQGLLGMVRMVKEYARTELGRQKSLN